MTHRKSGKRVLTLDKDRKKLLGVCAGVADYLDVQPWSIRLVFLISVLFGGWFLIPIYFIAWFCLDDKPGEGLGSLADSQPLRHFRSVDYRKQLYRNTEDGKFLGICAGVADYLEVNVFAVRLVFLVLLILTSGIPLIVYLAAYFILEAKPVTKHQRGRYRKSAARQHDFSRFSKIGRSFHEEESSSGGSDGGNEAFSDEQQSQERPADPKEKHARPDFGDWQDDEQGEAIGAFAGKSYSKRREFKYCVRKFSTLQNRLEKVEAYVTSSQFRLHREFKNI